MTRRRWRKVGVALVAGLGLAVWWYLARGPKATLRGGGGPVYTVAFAPDGKTLASGGADGLIRLWDVETFHLRKVLNGGSGFVLRVAFAPDGTRLAATHSEDLKKTWIWDVITGEREAVVPWDERPGWVVWRRNESPDGRLKVTTERTYPLRTLTLVEAATGRKVVTLAGHPDQLNDWAFRPQGDVLATEGGYTDHPWPINAAGDLRLWDVKTGRLLAVCVRHWGAVDGVAFSPDGRLLASACYDGKVRVWDVGKVLGR